MSQDLHSPLSTRLRQPLDSVDNDLLRQPSSTKPGVDLLKMSNFGVRLLSATANTGDEDCGECKVTHQRVESLQSALLEVIEQNEALKAHTAELEAALNSALEELEELTTRRRQDSMKSRSEE